MELNFATSGSLQAGTYPAAYHHHRQILQLLTVSSGGKLQVQNADTPNDEFDTLTWSSPETVAPDNSVQWLKLEYWPGVGVYGVWESEGRHRLGIFEYNSGLSKYLAEGTITLRIDDPVATLDLTLKNPNQALADEEGSTLSPGSQLSLQLRMGDSEAYPMGVFYIDHSGDGLVEPTVQLDGRNTIGRLLKEQTFDETRTFPAQNLQQTFEAVLDVAGVLSYLVGPTSFSVGMEFPRNMPIYDGITELLKTVRNWRIGEGLDGTIKIGFVSGQDSPFDQPGKYTFLRDSEVFAQPGPRRSLDDTDSYARVCVHTADWAVISYQAVPMHEGWAIPAQKTLYVQIAEGSTQQAADDYAAEIAGRLSQIGIIETFTGPIRPQLMPGDEAEIVSANGSRLLGVITTVVHRFGDTGYTTEFTVDSGGQVAKAQVWDQIAKIGQTSSVGTPKRLY